VDYTAPLIPGWNLCDNCWLSGHRRLPYWILLVSVVCYKSVVRGIHYTILVVKSYRRYYKILFAV